MADLLDVLRSISGLLGSGALAIAIAAWFRSRPSTAAGGATGQTSTPALMRFRVA